MPGRAASGSDAKEELCRQQVCVRSDASAVEICDRSWPHEKAGGNSGPDLASFWVAVQLAGFEVTTTGRFSGDHRGRSTSSGVISSDVRS